MDPYYCLALDTLHTLNLGVMNVFCRVAIWALLASGVYGFTSRAEDAIVSNMLVMRRNLFDFYKRHHVQFPNAVLTQVSDWLPSMIGSFTEQKCKTKGAETWGICLFVIDELCKFQARVDGWQRLERAGRCLEGLVLVWRSQGWVMSETSIQELVGCQHVFWFCVVLNTCVLC